MGSQVGAGIWERRRCVVAGFLWLPASVLHRIIDFFEMLCFRHLLSLEDCWFVAALVLVLVLVLVFSLSLSLSLSLSVSLGLTLTLILRF